MIIVCILLAIITGCVWVSVEFLKEIKSELRKIRMLMLQDRATTSPDKNAEFESALKSATEYRSNVFDGIAKDVTTVRCKNCKNIFSVLSSLETRWTCQNCGNLNTLDNGH